MECFGHSFYWCGAKNLRIIDASIKRVITSLVIIAGAVASSGTSRTILSARDGPLHSIL